MTLSCKKILLSSLCLCLFALPALAANLGDAFKVDDSQTNDGLDNASRVAGYNINQADSGGVTVEGLVSTSIKAVLGLLGVVFVCLVIYGGIIWMNAGGNEKKVEEGRAIISQALIGLIVVLAASAISYFVMNAFAPGSSDSSLQTAENVQP